MPSKYGIFNYYNYYEKEDGTYRVYNSKNYKLETLDRLPSKGTFHMMKGYDASDEGLISFKNDFKEWIKEIRYNKIFSIFYAKYYSHYSAVELTFKRLCKGKYEHFDPITLDEHDLHNKCFNGGLGYLNPEYKDKLTECHGYDFTANYPTILKSHKLKIPTGTPTEHILLKLPKRKEIELGIYHVNITSSHPHIKHIFAFSKDNHYTDCSLKFALKHKKKFNINIELIQDDETNAFIYDDCVRGSDIFGEWFDSLIQLKNAFPKNKLIKHLMSSLWGTLTHLNTINKTYQEIIDQNIDMVNGYNIHELIIKPDREYYVLVPQENPYRYDIRIKPFLSSYARINIANVILDNMDSFVRVQVDGSVFSKEINYDKYEGLLPEDKTTGKLKWSQVNQAEDDKGNVIIGKKKVISSSSDAS
jgi:hypothetical protein